MRLLRDTILGIAMFLTLIYGGLAVLGSGGDEPSQRAGQSADVRVTAGQTAQVTAFFTTADGKLETVTRTIYAAKAGRYIIYLYPSDGRVDDPAIFLVDVNPK